MRTVLAATVIGAGSSLAAAQQPTPRTDFPPDAQPVATDALKQRVGGKVFNVATGNGNVWRVQLDNNGYMFLNISPTGYADSGKWRVDEGKLCFEPQKTKASCNETKLAGDRVWFRRDNGEVVKMEPN